LWVVIFTPEQSELPGLETEPEVEVLRNGEALRR